VLEILSPDIEWAPGESGDGDEPAERAPGWCVQGYGLAIPLDGHDPTDDLGGARGRVEARDVVPFGEEGGAGRTRTDAQHPVGNEEVGRRRFSKRASERVSEWASE
jgi:hypothetical protein